MLTLLLPLALAAAPPPPDWEAVVDRVLPAVVTIRAASPRAFDTDLPGSSTATAFVVDAERGILLTNRHVVEAGPVVAEAVFANHEEVPLVPLYRDPVHDFGFFRFDPAAVRHQAVTALELAPEAARVGVEIRVLGSDAGEKVSILSGTLARLDRDAPSYGAGSYNDFNTFYLQAASGTSGGSSGSPVFDRQGRVVALNAGASRTAATSFYLPLDRVERALERIQRGEAVTRGGLQVVFRHRTYDEARRLGLSPATEAAWRARDPQATGLLVVEEVLKDGPAWGQLLPGDVLLAVDGEPIGHFVPLEAKLDDAVGRELELRVERGGQPVTARVRVEDLHAITPDRWVEVGGAVIHRLSFQQARNYAVPVRGLYVATPGYQFETAAIGRGSVIVEADGEPVDTPEALLAVLERKADRQWVTFRYFTLDEPNRLRADAVRVDRRFFPLQLCRRDDTTGTWPCVAGASAPAAAPEAPVGVPLPDVTEPFARKLQPGLVWVQTQIPIRVEGAYAGYLSGTGVVVDAERGLVLTDRDTVPVRLGVVTLVFGGAQLVPAEVVAVHPVHNLALVRFDPAALGGTPIATVPLAPRSPKRGDPTWHLGLNRHQETLARRTEVTSVDALVLPLPRSPFFRDANLGVLSIEESAGVVGGLLADRKGRLTALWASFVDLSGDKPTSSFRGIPVEEVRAFVEPFQRGEVPRWSLPGFEVVPVALAGTRGLGLPPEVVAELAARGGTRPQAWQVERVTAGSPAARVLVPGDLVVDADDVAVRSPRDLEAAFADGLARLRVYRRGAERTETLLAWEPAADGVTRFVQWAGAVLHTPHPEVATQQGIPATGVYVAWTWNGSPAPRYGLRPTWRIEEVDGRPVADLDAFLAAVQGRPDRASVRLRVVTLDGRPSVLTVKLDLQYHPTVEYRLGPEGWSRSAR